MLTRLLKLSLNLGRGFHQSSPKGALLLGSDIAQMIDLQSDSRATVLSGYRRSGKSTEQLRLVLSL